MFFSPQHAEILTAALVLLLQFIPLLQGKDLALRDTAFPGLHAGLLALPCTA